MEEKFKNLSDVFGNLSKIEENPKSAKKKDETFMMDLLEHLCQIEAVSAVVRTIGIQADKYENPFYKSIKLLMTKVSISSRFNVPKFCSFKAIYMFCK